MKQKNKKSVRVRGVKGYGPRHMMNAQEGSEAVPGELPSPPDWVEAQRRRVTRDGGMANLTPGILGGLGEAGSQLAGMSKEDVAKLAISMLAGGEEMPLGEPGAVPLRKWSSWDTAQKAGGGRGPIKSDGVGNYYEQIGEHATTNPDVQHVIVKPVEKPVYDFGKWQEQVGKGGGQYEEPPLDPEEDKRGKAKVGVAKGFGPGHAENSKEGEDLTQVNTDTVPAMLTPREAVLNRNAAELAGRGTIEKLNSEGNKLAKKGVDLAAGGESDVGLSDILKTYQAGGDLTPEEIARVIAVLKGGGGASEPSVATQVPKYGQYHDELPDLSNPNRARGDGDVANYNGKQLWDAIMTALQGRQAPAEKLGPVPVPSAMAQKGTSDMKSKVKQSKPQSGSPYVQAFQKLLPKGGAPVGYQGGGGNVGGTDPMMPGMGGGLGARDQYGRQFSNRDASGGFASGNGVAPPVPGGTGVDPVAGGPFPGRGPGGVYPGGGYQPAGVGVGGTPGGPFPGRGPGGVYPGALGMPGMQGPGQMPTQNIGSLQPYLPGNRGSATGLADGTSNVGPIGTPPQGEQAYGPPVNLTAPQIQQLAKQTGISPTQIMGLMKAFQGGKDIYNSVGTGGGYANQSPSAGEDFGNPNYIGLGTPSYQGGISDIGYPPFVAPSASYDGNRGGWLGPYDPSFMIQRYAGGTSYVSPFR